MLHVLGLAVSLFLLRSSCHLITLHVARPKPLQRRGGIWGLQEFFLCFMCVGTRSESPVRDLPWTRISMLKKYINTGPCCPNQHHGRAMGNHPSAFPSFRYFPCLPAGQMRQGEEKSHLEHCSSQLLASLLTNTFHLPSRRRRHRRPSLNEVMSSLKLDAPLSRCAKKKKKRGHPDSIALRPASVPAQARTRMAHGQT